MSSNELVEQIMAQVIARVATPEHEVLPETTHQTRETAMAEKSCTLTEFVGTAIGDTVGLVIANVDSALLDAMKLEKRYRSIGILGARIGAGPHIMAADEAVKATNTEVISIELPRDTKGGAGHGSLILLGGNDVSDVKRGIEVALKNSIGPLAMSMPTKPDILSCNIPPAPAMHWKKRLVHHWDGLAALLSALQPLWVF